MSNTDRNVPVTVAGVTVPPGRRRQLDIPAGRLVTGTELSIPAAVVNGRKPGPHVWLTGVIHGDEVMGAEIIRRVLASVEPATLGGCVIAVPIVNVFGFIEGSRYLPDRRDLNRSFPGSARGSLAGRLARLVMDHVVANADIGIDFHTGTDHRFNLAQVRANLDDDETMRLANEFGTSVVVHARLRDGSLRSAATALGKQVLVYEAGEAYRFNEQGIEAGVTGTLRVLGALGMINATPALPRRSPVVVHTMTWVRARRSGICLLDVQPGDRLEKGQKLGEIRDALGGRPTTVRAPETGIALGVTRDPVVNRGEALVNVGIFD